MTGRAGGAGLTGAAFFFEAGLVGAGAGTSWTGTTWVATSVTGAVFFAGAALTGAAFFAGAALTGAALTGAAFFAGAAFLTGAALDAVAGFVDAAMAAPFSTPCLTWPDVSRSDVLGWHESPEDRGAHLHDQRGAPHDSRR